MWSDEEKANQLIACSLEIEKQIMQFCEMKPEKITDESIAEFVEVLKEYEIK